MAQADDLNIEEGATFRRVYVYVSALTPLTPIDITGYTARMQFREKFSDVLPLLSLTHVLSTDGQIILGGAAGTVQIYIKHTTTETMSGGGVYDLELVEPVNGDVIRFIQGGFGVSPNVTR